MQHSPRKFWEVWGRSDALYNRWAAAHGVNNYRLFVLLGACRVGRVPWARAEVAVRVVRAARRAVR